MAQPMEYKEIADQMVQLHLNPILHVNVKFPQVPEDYNEIYNFMQYAGFCARVDAANRDKFVDRPTMDKLWRVLCYHKIAAQGVGSGWSVERMQDELDDLSGWTIGYNGFRPFDAREYWLGKAEKALQAGIELNIKPTEKIEAKTSDGADLDEYGFRTGIRARDEHAARMRIREVLMTPRH